MTSLPGEKQPNRSKRSTDGVRYARSYSNSGRASVCFTTDPVRAQTTPDTVTLTRNELLSLTVIELR